MPYDKGDFTQHGVNGKVAGGLLLNNKRDVDVLVSTNEDDSTLGVVAITIEDHLNGLKYSFWGENLEAGEVYEIGGGNEMQLYGPYVATLSASKSIGANHGEPVDLTKIVTFEGTELTYPDSDAIIVVNSVASGNLDLTGFFAPVYMEGEWRNAYINVYNHSVDAVPLTSSERALIFYSSVEFTTAE